jgi:hypothetical protein
MNPGERGVGIGRLGGLAASAVAAAPFAYLWVQMMVNADDPLTARARLDMAIGMAVFATPWVIAAGLLWRAWWRRAGARLSTLDGPGWLLAAAAAMLPADRRDWGAAMAAELAQVKDRPTRWRFALGCARTAVFPPRDHRAAPAVTGGLAVVAAALAAGAVLPAGRVFAPVLVGLVGGLAVRVVARRGRAGAGLAVAGLVLAVVLAGCLWLAVTPPRWLAGDCNGRRVGVAMSLVLAAGFVLSSRLALRGVAGLDAGMMGYVLLASPLVVLTGSAAAAAAGRSFRSGLAAAAWATVLGGLLVVVAWLAEAPHWYRQGRGLHLDGEGAGGGRQPGRRGLVDPDRPGAVGAAPRRDRDAAGSARARRRRAREQARLAELA